MRLIVLTGGIACGKSTVGEIFTKKYSIPIVDADAIARKLQEIDGPAYKKMVEVFGADILNEDGSIDRKKVGELVFNNPEQRQKLNSITHPLIRKEINKQIFKHFLHCEKYVLVDIPLFFEVKKKSTIYADVITVATTPKLQIERLMKRNNLSEEEATNRINAQMPIEEKCARSSIVIRNNSTQEDLERQIDEIYQNWEKSFRKSDFFDVRSISALIVLFTSLVSYYFFK